MTEATLSGTCISTSGNGSFSECHGRSGSYNHILPGAAHTNVVPNELVPSSGRFCVMSGQPVAASSQSPALPQSPIRRIRHPPPQVPSS